MAIYEVWLADDQGYRLADLSDYESLDYVISMGAPGWCKIKIPYGVQRKATSGVLDIFRKTVYDRQIQIWRTGTTPGNRRELMQVYFARRYTYTTDRSGRDFIIIEGPGPNDILARRIIAYYASKPETEVSGTVDDLIKGFVRDQLASDADTDYDGAAITTRSMAAKGFSVQVDTSSGPTINKHIFWTNLLEACQGLQATSRAVGTEVFFNVVPLSTSPTTFQLVTRTGQWHADRTLSSGAPLRFGKDWGNVGNSEIIDDATYEQNVIYAGGQGTGYLRIVQEVSDTNAINRSRYNRREGFVNATEVVLGATNETAEITAIANERLNEMRPTTVLTAELLDTTDTPFGGREGWKFGDKVTVTQFGRQFDAHIRSLQVTKYGGEDGDELIRARIDSHD